MRWNEIWQAGIYTIFKDFFGKSYSFRVIFEKRSDHILHMKFPIENKLLNDSPFVLDEIWYKLSKSFAVKRDSKFFGRSMEFLNTKMIVSAENFNFSMFKN